MILPQSALLCCMRLTVLRPMQLPTQLSAISTNCADPDHPCLPSLSLAEKGAPLPPCIHHIVAERDYVSVRHLVMDEVSIGSSSPMSGSYLDELADFGAIYTASNKEGKTSRMESKTELDETAPKDTYVRLYQNPIRRRGALGIDWSKRVLPIITTATPKFIAVDKPSGVPMQAGVDNRVENLQYQLGKHMHAQVIVTTRLDICTSGCTVLGLSRRAVSVINKAVREGDVYKEYLALTRKPVPLGQLDHCFKKGGKLHKHSKPTLLKAFDADLLERDPHWKLASLQVLDCQALSTGSAEFFEVRIRLITGRTHQIRLQLAALDCPLVGDSRYAGVAGLLDDSSSEAGDANMGHGHGDGSGLFGAQPDRIGLHCSILDFGRSCEEQLGLTRVRSYNPWWRRQ